jgi:FG-GAP-like repeat
MKLPFWSPVLLFIVILVTNGAASASQLFGSPRNIPISGGGPFIALGDLNDDRTLDIVVGSTFGAPDGNGLITVLRGNGDGTFKTPVQYETRSAPGAFALADVNCDGKLDFIALNSCGFSVPACPAGNIQVFLGNGDGTFLSPIFSLGSTDLNPVSVAVADFNGDGILDLATTFEQVAFLPLFDIGLVFNGNGDGSFSSGSLLQFGNLSNLLGIVAADFNGDGKVDLALLRSQHGNVDILLGNGDGTFTHRSSFHTGPGRSLTSHRPQYQHIQLLL